MGLRLRDGIDPSHFAALGGIPLADVIDDAVLAMLKEEQLVAADSLIGDAPLKVTARGMPVLNAIIAALVRDGDPTR